MTTYAQFLDRTVHLGNGCRVPVSIRWPGRPLKVTWDGYLQVTVDGKRQRGHQAAWELLNGSVPRGLTLDHLCRFRPCCEVLHLEPVPNRVNVMRGDLPDLPELARVHLTRVSRSRRQCAVCDLESNPGGMGLHHKASGHDGWVAVPDFDVQTSGG